MCSYSRKKSTSPTTISSSRRTSKPRQVDLSLSLADLDHILAYTSAFFVSLTKVSDIFSIPAKSMKLSHPGMPL